MSLQEIVTRREKLTAHDAMVRQNFADHQARFKAEITKLSEAEAMIVAGLDIDKIEAGRAVIYINGNVNDVRNGSYSDQNRKHVRPDAVEAARKDIANGCARLRTEYVGVKNYEGFGDQREDHGYGYGPRHGSTVFEIGLTRDVRARFKDGGELTPEEIEAALYVLTALPQIEAARAKVAA